MVGNVLTESLGIVGATHPASQGAGVVNGPAIDMQFFNRALFLLDVGVISAGGTVDFKLQCSIDAAFTAPVNIPNKAIAQLTQAGGNGNQICKVGLQQEDLQNLGVGNDARYARYVLTIGTAAALVGVTALGAIARWKPESKKDIAAVVQTISDAS